MSSGGWHEADGTEPPERTANRPKRREISPPPLSLTEFSPVRPGGFFPVFHGGFGFLEFGFSRGLRPSWFWFWESRRIVSINDFSFWLNKVGTT